MFEMKGLDQKDMESIAKGRVARQESRKTNYVWVGVLVGIIAAIILMRINTVATYVVLFAVIVGLFWYMGKLSKKQKLAFYRLMYDAENAQKKAPNKAEPIITEAK